MIALKYLKIFLFGLLSAVPFASFSQDTTGFRSKGHLYGEVFADYFYKAHADTMERGFNQYATYPKNSNAFQIRRIYLGYQYDFSDRFSADILLESTLEDGDLTLFVKYANIQWKDIFPGTDFVIGRMKTPTFSTLTDKVWGYRSVERSIADMHGSPSNDLGVALWGRFDLKNRFGYALMVGNGSGMDLIDDRFKKFYGEVYAKLFDKKLIVDLYADYERFHWRTAYHQSAAMFKAFAAYQTADLTIGVEAYRQHLQNGALMGQQNGKDTVSIDNYGISVFAHGKFPGEKLGYFARIDHLIPSTKAQYKSAAMTSLVPEYDPAYRSRFITAGIDYEPVENVHFMPNIWYCGYENRISGQQKDYDLVYRLTFFYEFEG